MENLEQKDCVSENPEVKDQDIERNSSSENEPAIVESAKVVPPEDTRDEVVIKEVKTKTTKKKKIDTPEDVVKKEGDETEVQINFDEIVMDKDGIPEITKNDIQRIKAFEIAVSDFESEISEARRIIKDCNKELSEKYQEKFEKESKDLIAQLTAEEAEINSKGESISDEDKERLSNIKTRLEILNENVTKLPKYDKKTKNNLEKRILNAKKHIAVYQLVARKDIGKMIEDGTIIGIISSSSNAVFSQLYINKLKESDVGSGIEDDKTIIEFDKQMKKIETKYYIYGDIDRCIKELSKINIAYLVNHVKSFSADKYKDKAYVGENEDIDIEELKKVGETIRFISTHATKDSNLRVAKETLSNVKLSLIGMEENQDEVLQTIKDTRKEESEFVDEVEKYENLVGIILYETPYTEEFISKKYDIEKVKSLLGPITDDDKLVSNVTDAIDYLKYTFDASIEKYTKEYEDIEDKKDEEKERLIKPYKDEMRSNGLFSSFTIYSLITAGAGSYYVRPESLLEPQHVFSKADHFANVIRSLMRDKNDEMQYNSCKNNVNAVSMNYNNYIRYFYGLYKGNSDLEWASQFDPTSVLKNFYFENKEELNKAIELYDNTISVLSHVMCHNGKFIKKYEDFVAKFVDFVNENDQKLKKLDTNKKVKDKFDFMTRIAFVYQFINSYKEFVKDIGPVNEEVRKKREMEPNLSNEEFNKWYDENLKEKELAATSKPISSFLHLLLGCTVVAGFDDYYNEFISKNKNKGIAIDCEKYIFNEYVLDGFAFKECPEDKNYADFMKEKAKNIAFKSVDFSLQNDVDVKNARLDLITHLFNYATVVFRGLIKDTCEEKEVKKEENKESKKKITKTIDHAALRKSYKDKRKENKKNAFAKLLTNQYRNFFNELQESSIKPNNLLTYSVFSDYLHENELIDKGVITSNDEFELFCDIGKSLVTFKLLKVKKASYLTESDDVKNKNVLINRNNESFNIKTAYDIILKTDVKGMTSLNVKYYYEDHVNRNFDKFIEKDNLSNNEKLLLLVSKVIEANMEKIVKKIENYNKEEEKDMMIVFKQNKRLNIKYLSPDKYANNVKNIKENGNLDFVNCRIWSLYSFELSYDLVKR